MAERARRAVERTRDQPDRVVDGGHGHGDAFRQVRTAPVARACVSILAGLALTAGAIGPASAQAGGSATPALLAEARALINQDKPEAAIQKLSAVDAPDRPDVALVLGVAYYHVNDHLHAIRAARTNRGQAGGGIDRTAGSSTGARPLLLPRGPLRRARFPGSKRHVNGPPGTRSSGTSSGRRTSRRGRRTGPARRSPGPSASKRIPPRRIWWRRR